jgi:8-oxo-dGTP diphosphatase
VALVVDDGCVLLIKRARDPWRGHWDIPGGFCEPGEHPLATAERELLEETGRHGRCTELLGVWMDTYGPPHADGLQETTLNLVYLASLLDVEPAAPADAEATEIRWFALERPPGELAFPAHIAPALETARRRLAGVTPRPS